MSELTEDRILEILHKNLIVLANNSNNRLAPSHYISGTGHSSKLIHAAHLSAMEEKDRQIKELKDLIEKLGKTFDADVFTKSDLMKENQSLREALAELVELKRIKDTQGKTEEYLRRQPKAWEAASNSIKR
jgi:hypothetical protein